MSLDEAARRAARNSRCLHCGAQPGQPCVTNGPRKRPLARGVMHDSRITGAGAGAGDAPPVRPQVRGWL